MSYINKIVVYAVAVNMALFLASCSSSPKAPVVNPGEIPEARNYIKDQVIHRPDYSSPIMLRVFGKGDSYVKAIDITPARMKITTENNIGDQGNLFIFPLKQLTPGKACEEIGNTCLVSIIRYGDLNRGSYTSYEFYLPKNAVKDFERKADKLIYALSTLQQGSLQMYSKDAQFQDAVDKYLTASPKPALPEAAQKLKLQAENAAHDKRFDDASDYYQQALVIAPWWPEGHFNLALNLAESKYYYGAVDEMKCYLMLAPEGTDAKAAQDKIDEWQQKTTKPKWYEF